MKKFFRNFWRKFNAEDLHVLLEVDKEAELQRKKKKKMERRATIATIDLTLLNQEDKKRVNEMLLYQNMYDVGLTL